MCDVGLLMWEHLGVWVPHLATVNLILKSIYENIKRENLVFRNIQKRYIKKTKVNAHGTISVVIESQYA